MTQRSTSGLFLLFALSLVLVIGVETAANPQVAFVLVVCMVGALALAAPAGAWVLAAVVAALTFKGLVTLGLLPGIAAYLDIPIAWGALLAGFLARSGSAGRAGAQLRWLGLLAAAVFLAWAFHPSEVLRPLLYLALLGEPFAIVCALLLDPPSPRLRQFLVRSLVALVAAQVVLSAWQVRRFGLGSPDKIQGTLWGAGAGAHVMSAAVVLGCLWLLASRRGRLNEWVLVAVAALVAVPIVADAKQVLFALPAAALVAGWRSGRYALVLNVGLMLSALALLIVFDPVSKDAIYRLQEARSGNNGKEQTAKIIWHRLDSNPASLAFGEGPAETVSRAAFLTTPLQLQSDSPLRSLGLRPATLAVEVQTQATQVSGGRTSFNSGVSSMLGVFGDLGLFGAVAYLGLLVSVIRPLWRRRSALAVTATAGWAMFAVLGFVYDWWEQPPFTVFLGVLTGLALTTGNEQHDT